jgi:hypothetical protein
MALKAYVPEHRAVPLAKGLSLTVKGLTLEGIIHVLRDHHEAFLAMMDQGVDMNQMILHNLPMAYEIIYQGIVDKGDRVEDLNALATYPAGHVIKLFVNIWELSFIDLADVVKILTTLIKDAQSIAVERTLAENAAAQAAGKSN